MSSWHLLQCPLQYSDTWRECTNDFINSSEMQPSKVICLYPFIFIINKIWYFGSWDKVSLSTVWKADKKKWVCFYYKLSLVGIAFLCSFYAYLSSSPPHIGAIRIYQQLLVLLHVCVQMHWSHGDCCSPTTQRKSHLSMITPTAITFLGVLVLF